MISTYYHVRLIRKHASALAALLAIGVPILSEGAVQAHLDRSTTTPDQPFVLSITSDTAAPGSQPNLAPLRADFQVLGTSSGSETSIVNGQRSDQLRWTIRLQPKHAGLVEIAPIEVGSDRTQALKMEVTDVSPAQRATDAQHVFVEVDAHAAGGSTYVQQQVPYTVRLFYDDSVTPAELDAPASVNAIVEQLGSDKHYTAIRHGHDYNVIERDYAIAPEKSGAIPIAAPEFRGTETVAGHPSKDPDPQDDMISRMLAGTPFANMASIRSAFRSGSSFADETRPITARGEEVTLDVKPRPAGFQGGWLPAEALALHDSWAGSVPAFKVGEPITRVITVQAKGLDASQIPTLSIASPANARIYPEAPENESRTDGQTIYGSSKQSVTYIPTQPGAMEVPGIEMTWWDLRSNVERHATIPALHLDVAAGVATAQAGHALPAAGALPIDQSRASRVSIMQASPIALYVKVIACLAFLGALAAVLIYAQRRQRSTLPGAVERPHPADSRARKGAAMRALRDACAANDPHQAARALLELASLQCPGGPPRGLDALAARLDGGRQEVLDLERCLYGGSRSRWEGGALWRAVRGGLRPSKIAARAESSGLDPLYPDPSLT